jgi:cytoskeletal protein RodZ
VTEPGAAHKLGDVLRAAREARGVDLARVERDTKIRARYLAALETGEYRDLPGAVYTKGFLRNYGAYLGLDAEYLIDLYRLESSSTLVDRPTVPTPPRPISTRRGRAFVVTPGAVVAALLTVGVAIFIVYLVSEFVTFARTPELRITDPLGDVASYDSLTYTMRGVTEPNSTIRVDGAVENADATADGDGAFEIEITLVPGSNVITLVASDPVTKRDSEPVTRTIVVGEDASPSPVAALTVTSPEEGAALTGAVAIAGTAAPNASVTVTATFVSPAPASFRVVTLAGQEVPLPATPPAAPSPLALTASAAGAFEGSLALLPGAWDVTITPGDSGGVAADAVTRRVTVGPAAGLAGSLVVAGGQSYLEIDQDGVPMADVSGRVANPGADIALSASNVLRIRVGNAGAVRLTINGIDMGLMGGSGAVVEWQITRL